MYTTCNGLLVWLDGTVYQHQSGMRIQANGGKWEKCMAVFRGGLEDLDCNFGLMHICMDSGCPVVQIINALFYVYMCHADSFVFI